MAERKPRTLSVDQFNELERPPESLGEIVSRTGESVGRQALDAFTIGYGDEIIAGVQSLMSDEEYEDLLAKSEARTQEFQRQTEEDMIGGVNPINLAGLATGGGSVIAATRLAPVVSRLPGMVRTMTGGGVVGGIAGAGQPGTLEERATSVVPGAAVGAVAGPAAAGAARLGMAGVQGLTNIARRFLPGQQAARGREALSRAIERDETTPQAMAERLEQYGPQAVIADVAGPNVQRRGYLAAELEGPARTQAQDLVESRSRQQGERVSQAFREAMDEQRSFHQVTDELNQARMTAAAPLYREVHAQTIEPTERMRQILDRDSITKAYRFARSLASEDGITLPDLRQLRRGEADITGLQTWDYIKRGLDEHVGNLASAARRGESRGMYRAADRTRRELLEDLDEIFPRYAEARAAWAGPSRSMELLEEGRDIFGREDPEDFIARYAELDEGERDFFRLGVVQEVTKRIGDLSDNRNAAQFWTKPNNRRKLAALFPEGNMSTFIDRMVGEGRATETARVVLGGSPTAPREALGEQAALESFPAIMNVLRAAGRGDILGAGEQAGRAIANRRIPLAQRTAEGEILFERNRPRQLEMLADLERQQRRTGTGRRVENILATVAAGAGAGTAAQDEETRRIARMLLGGS